MKFAVAVVTHKVTIGTLRVLSGDIGMHSYLKWTVINNSKFVKILNHDLLTFLIDVERRHHKFITDWASWTWKTQFRWRILVYELSDSFL